MIPKPIEYSRHSPLFLKEQVRLFPGSRDDLKKVIIININKKFKMMIMMIMMMMMITGNNSNNK